MRRMLFRKFANRKIQTLGMVFLTFLWMFVSSFAVNLYTTNLDFQKNYYAETNIEDFNFIPFNIEEMDSIAERFNFVYEVQYINDLEENDLKLRVLSVMKEINKPYIVTGKMPENKCEILLNQEFAQENDISVGDTFIIKDKEYKVSGLITLVNYIRMHVRDDSLNYDPETEAIVMANEDAIMEMPMESFRAAYVAKLADKLTKEDRESIYQEIIRSKDFAAVTLQSENTNISTYDGKISIYFLITVISLFIMSFIIIVLLIMFLYILIREDKKAIGCFVANGMKKTRIFAEYSAAILMLLVPAGIIGYLAGYFYSPVLNTVLEADLSLPQINFEFKPMIFGIFTVIVIWVSVLASLCGTIAILRENVIELLKNMKLKKISKFEKIIKKLTARQKIEKKIKMSFAIRSKLLLVLVLFSVFAAGVEFFLSYSIYMLPEKIKEAQSNSIQFENQVYFANLNEKITENDQYYYQVNGVADSATNTAVISLYAMEQGELLDIGVSRLGKNEAVINQTTADVLKAGVGDVLVIGIYENSVEVKVVGVCDRIVGKEIFMDYQSLTEDGIIDAVYSGMYTNKEDITKETDINIVSIISREEIFENYENSQEVMKYGAVILAVLGVVIPIILIAITVSILISENKREIAIFRANGIEDKTMNRLIYGSYNVFLVFGLLISIPYSYMILNIIFSIAVKASGIKYPVELDGIGILIAVAMTMIVYFGTMFVLKQRNRKTMEKIRYDFG